mmetsp:Transcript_100502/g.313237  ORF Transcript_100502/g.313237 Transcript_100502/m.313237 type:complete len:166 (-) Transcript_100502:502-999(-)
MSEMSEVLHPLSVGACTIIGLPGAAFAKRMISIVRSLLPKSMAEAQLCSGNRRQQPITACPYVMKHVAGGPDVVPDFLGGRCPVSGASVEGAMVEEEEEEHEEDEEDFAECPTAARVERPLAEEVVPLEATPAQAPDADAAVRRPRRSSGLDLPLCLGRFDMWCL